VKNLSKKQLLEIIQEQAAQLKKRDEQIETLQAALEIERVENALDRSP
jgi:predicted ribonuclease toxin of YeeF-YezG toxin-antitoxin module